MPIMTAIPLEHPAMGPASAGTVTGFLITIGSLGGTIGQLSYTWMLEVFGAREVLMTMGILCSIITLFTIPLSETGAKNKNKQ